MGLLTFSPSYAIFTALHVACFAVGLTVCGLYGRDLKRAMDSDEAADSKWIYAVVVGALSAVTCVAYFLPIVLRLASGIVMAAWDFILFALWIAVFGIFAKMYIDEDPEGDAVTTRMKEAMWVDLAGAILWLIATLASLGYWWKHRDTRSRFTGRAHV